MRSLLIAALVVSAASAAHVAHVPSRARHVGVARELADGSNLTRRAGLKRLRRCTAPSSGPASSGTQVSAVPTSPAATRPPTADTPSSSPSSSSAGGGPSSHHAPPSSSPPSETHTQEPATNAGTQPATTVTRPNPKPTSTQDNNNDGPTETLDGAAPASTHTSPADPWLSSLSKPLNYPLISDFTKVHHGEMTFYAQGQTACGDVYTDRTLTAAVSKYMYDSWPGCDSATNRCPICGPFTTGRVFIFPSDVKVPGKDYAVIGGDGLINCAAGVQCHRPLTATVTNPHTGLKVKVAIVDRCDGCAHDDIDLSPAAFLKATRTDLDLGSLDTSQLLLEALKDHDGRITVQWQFDEHQEFGPVQSV